MVWGDRMIEDLTQYFKRTELEFYQLIKSMKPETYTGRYAMHRYWARKPYNIVAEFIKYYTKPGEIVLDPFCGSGVTLVESLILRRKAIAVDIDPMATFVTKMTAINIDLNEFQRAFSYIREKVLPLITMLYTTICPKCGKTATMLSLIWKRNEPKKMRYVCGKCGEDWKEVTQYDKEVISMTEKMTIPCWYPTNALIENTRINVHKGMKVPDLFTRRNLIALSLIFDAISSLPEGSVKELMKFTFTASLSQASKMVFVVRRRGRQTGQIQETEEVGSRVIGYWIPDEHFEINAWSCFENRFRRVLRGKKETNKLIGNYYKEATSFEDLKNSATVWILTQSATNLSNIPSESVDYVFTDPPFGDQVPYLELNALWSSWLGFQPNYGEEIIISDSPERNKGFDDYAQRIRMAFAEIYRVLKKDKYLSVVFYNYDLRVWHTLISACVEAGFQKVSILPIKNSHPSIVQLYRYGGTKGALVITFKKTMEKYMLQSKPNNIEELIVASVKEVIERTGGSATTYQIYDSIISTLINNNALDEENKVKAILKKHFEFRNGRWFVKTGQNYP
jgi:DNA modification methylase/ribosomal protein S27AE